MAADTNQAEEVKAAADTAGETADALVAADAITENAPAPAAVAGEENPHPAAAGGAGAAAPAAASEGQGEVGMSCSPSNCQCKLAVCKCKLQSAWRHVWRIDENHGTASEGSLKNLLQIS